MSSVCFVLGFSLVFSLVGVLLQTVLSSVSYTAQQWFGRIGGVVIILFGLYLADIISPEFLRRERKLRVTQRFRSHYATSFRV